MDNVYHQDLITRIENELSVHDKKFSGSWIHSQCPERMRKVVNSLRRALDESRPSPESKRESGAETFRGDEMEPAKKMYQLARYEDELGDMKEAEETRFHAWEFVAEQLNEFDGFNR